MTQKKMPSTVLLLITTKEGAAKAIGLPHAMQPDPPRPMLGDWLHDYAIQQVEPEGYASNGFHHLYVLLGQRYEAP